MLRRLLLVAIRFYQRHLSPLKGWSCAWREYTGHASCSTLGYRAVRRHGVVAGLVLLRRRTLRCGAVHRRHAPVRLRPMAGQRGDCDPGCDLPCDSACDIGSCDWSGNSRGRRREKDDKVYVPPRNDRDRRRRDESRT